jgi:hypothetical protein
MDWLLSPGSAPADADGSPATRAHVLSGRAQVLRELTALLRRTPAAQQTVPSASVEEGLADVSLAYQQSLQQILHWAAVAVAETAAELQLLGEVEAGWTPPAARASTAPPRRTGGPE